MKIIKFVPLAAVAATLLMHAPATRSDDHRRDKVQKVSISAGTAFNLAPVFDVNGHPVFPWPHEVRGVVQVSDLGNCTVLFKVSIDSGAGCEGGHLFCLNGTMTITTLAGDELTSKVVGWIDPDPNDPKQPASMHILHYEVATTGGTGRLQGARGQGQINGIANFCGGDCFCESYAGVATWRYEGMLQLPRMRK